MAATGIAAVLGEEEDTAPPPPGVSLTLRLEREVAATGTAAVLGEKEDAAETKLSGNGCRDEPNKKRTKGCNRLA